MTPHYEIEREDRLGREQRYQYLYENMPVMFFEMDDQAVVVSVNTFGAEQLGYEPEELIGRSVLDIFHEDDQGLVEEQFQSLIEKGGFASWEFRKRRKDQSVLWVRETARTIRAASGCLEVMVVCQDITPRRQAEEKRREAERLVKQLSLHLEEAQELERRRIAVHLHDDVGQVLTLAKIKLAQLAEAERSIASRLMEIGDLVHHAIESTRALTFDLASPVLYDLGVADALRSLCDRQHPDCKTHFRFNSTGEVMNLPERITVPLYRIASELVFNVRKHAQAKEAWITLDRRGRRVDLAVKDDGRGFDPESIRDPTADHGVGLFSIGQRAELLGGRLEIRSEQGVGSTIAVSIELDEDGS